MKIFLTALLLFFGTAHAQIHEHAEVVLQLGNPQLKWEDGKQQLSLQTNPILAPFNVVQVEGYFPFATPKGFAKIEDEKYPLNFIDFGDGNYVGAVTLTEPKQNLTIEFLFDAGVKISEAGVLFTLDDEERQPSLPAQQITRVPKVRAPALIRRADWGAAAPNCVSWQPSYTYMAFHHSATPAAVSIADAKVKVKGFQTYHQGTNGWCDIGYQFLMDGAGNFYQGRVFQNESMNLSQVPTLAIGSHVGNNNTSNIGVSVIGCYHPPEGGTCTNTLSAAAVDSLAQMYAFLSDAYGMSETNLRGHRDWGGTSCPGDNNYGLLATLKTKIAAIKAQAVPNNEVEIPADITVDKVYPNPFANQAIVRIFLTEDAQVTIEAYTLTGQRANLVFDGLRSAGWQEIEWTPQNLASGTYPLRITLQTATGKRIERLSAATLMN